MRPLESKADLQVGRQAVAGCNPFTIQIATPAFLDPKKRAITDRDVACKWRSCCTAHKAVPPSSVTSVQSPAAGLLVLADYAMELGLHGVQADTKEHML